MILSSSCHRCMIFLFPSRSEVCRRVHSFGWIWGSLPSNKPIWMWVYSPSIAFNDHQRWDKVRVYVDSPFPDRFVVFAHEERDISNPESIFLLVTVVYAIFI